MTMQDQIKYILNMILKWLVYASVGVYFHHLYEKHADQRDLFEIGEIFRIFYGKKIVSIKFVIYDRLPCAFRGIM